MARIIENRFRCQTMGQDGLRFIRENFAWEAKVKELEQILLAYAQRQTSYLTSFADVAHEIQI